MGALRSAAERVEEGRAILVNAGERGRLGNILDLQILILYDLGEHHRAVTVVEESLELARQTGNSDDLAWALISVASERLLIGDHETARRALEDAAKLWKDLPHAAAWANYYRGWERLHAGDARAAVRLTRDARQTVTDNPTSRYWLAYYEWNNGEAALLAGDTNAARRALEVAIDAASGARFFTSAECTRVLLAMTSMAENRPAEAELLARRAIAELDRMGVRDCRTRGRVVLARALRALGKVDNARAVLTEAALISPSTEDVWIRWELAVALAEDEIANGDHDAASVRLARVVEEAEGFKIPDAALAAAVMLGELELSHPSTAAHGKARLKAAAKRAHAVGQGLVEKRAQAALRSRH